MLSARYMYILYSAVGDAYAAPALHMQRQAYFLGAAYAAPALHMQRPEKLNFLQNYKKIVFSTSS